MKGKNVALFGLGDQILYPDHFVDGMAILKDEFEKLGAEIHGEWSSEGYEHTGSEAEKMVNSSDLRWMRIIRMIKLKYVLLNGCKS